MKRSKRPDGSLLPLLATAIVLIVAGLVLPSLLDSTAQPVTNGPVTVELLTPVAGSTVSNTITLTARASSTAAPITKVEFWDVFNGVHTLIATVTNFESVPAPPKGLRVTAQ